MLSPLTIAERQTISLSPYNVSFDFAGNLPCKYVLGESKATGLTAHIYFPESKGVVGIQIFEGEQAKRVYNSYMNFGNCTPLLIDGVSGVIDTKIWPKETVGDNNTSMIWANYRLDDRKNGISGLVGIYGKTDNETFLKMMNLVKTIHVTETVSQTTYSKGSIPTGAYTQYTHEAIMVDGEVPHITYIIV